MDADVIAAKLAELSERVRRVRLYRPQSAEALEADPAAVDLVAFNLMLAVQACLDVASHLIADEGWAPARSLADSFRRLQDRGVLDAETAAAMGRAAGLRNVVAHVYADTDPELLFRAATTGLDDLEAFAGQVAAWIERQAG